MVASRSPARSNGFSESSTSPEPRLVDFWRYELTPKRRLSAVADAGPRRGALIRVDGGYADIHPWPELGDLPLDEQLALLARGETPSLTASSLEVASIDAA